MPNLHLWSIVGNHRQFMGRSPIIVTKLGLPNIAMSEIHVQPYKVKKVSVIAKGTDVLVREYVLDPGEEVMWHHHTEVADHYYGLEGTVVIETRGPATRHELRPGETMTVRPPTPHHVFNSGSEACRFLLIQGVGNYDFLKEE